MKQNIELSESCWLLFEKSDETRVSKGIDGYNDRTGKEYNYDNLVPNHKRLSSGDLAIIRKENLIIGYGVIGDIKQKEHVKVHRRCPHCNTTDIRERKTVMPRWKCGKCSNVFSDPHKTSADVHLYNAKIESFINFENPPDVQTIKGCASRGDGINSQLSMLNLDRMKLQAVFDGVELPISGNNDHRQPIGQGIGLSYNERRAVELFSMEKVVALYEEKGWEVEDKSSSSPFDLLAVKHNKRRFIEVKGTTGKGKSVILTHGEVKHVDEHSTESVLVVVSNVQLKKIKDKWVASGGKIINHQDPWIIDKELLHPTQFRYETSRSQKIQKE
jgi:ribosomal protein L37AE/L43A